MTDREKLVELIDEIIELYPSELEKLADHLIAHGVTVKEPQKPLTVSSIARMKGKKLWVEDKGKPSVVCVTLHRCVGSPAFCFNMIRKDGTMFHADVDDMDVRWRCWAEKPTEEERRAAEWEK